MSAVRFRDRVRAIAQHVDYRADYDWEIELDGGQVYVELLHWRPDALAGHMDWGRGGRRYLSETMTISQIVRTLFGLAVSYEEHEVREFFRYRGKQVFGPHIDVEALVDVADCVDFRDAGLSDTAQGYVDRARQRLLDAGEDPDRLVYMAEGSS